MPNYTIIGGGAYQSGSAAAKKAQELYNQYLANQKQAASASPTNSPIFTPPSGAAPTSFPSYAPTQTVSSLMGSGATLAPGPSSAGKGAFGLVPTTPNPISTAAGAITGNTANLPALSTLGTGTTKLSANLAQLPFQLNLPNYMGNLQQASANTASDLAGLMNPQQLNRLTQFAAERGGGIGVAPNSPNAITNLMTALNQGIQETQTRGQDKLAQLISQTPTGQPFNVAGQQLSPGDLQYWQDVATTRGAAPDPTEAAQANLDMLLRAIDAGKVAGFPGYGGGGAGGGMPRLTAPGAVLSPVSGAFGGVPYYGGGSSAYAPTSAPGAPSSAGDNWLEQYLNEWEQGSSITPGGPPVDYSGSLGGQPYPVDMTGSDYFGGSDYINFPFLPTV